MTLSLAQQSQAVKMKCQFTSLRETEKDEILGCISININAFMIPSEVATDRKIKNWNEVNPALAWKNQ